MREIKFRAWDENRKKWVYFRLDEIVNINHESLTDDEWAFIQLKNIGQYTGLKDKNGREIYEGDIVKGTGKNPIIYVVEWLDSYGGFAFVDKEKAIPAYEFLVNFCEVIGNIYENLELLEVGKDGKKGGL